MKKEEIIKKLKGTETEKVLLDAYSKECEARVKYGFYTSIAKKEGYEQIASIFSETSDNEKEHAEIWFDYLGKMNGTEKNLKDSAEVENYEATEMYINYANIARKEGFEEISDKFKKVAEIEKAHSDRFLQLAENISKGQVFKRTEKVIWQCRSCGYLVFDTSAPEVCPVCDHKQSYYQLQLDNF